MRVDRNRSAPRSPTSDIGEGCRDQHSIRDHDELALGAELEREVVGGRAGVEGDRFSVVDEGGGRAGDRLLAIDLEPEPEVEAELGLAALQRPHAAADSRHEPLPSKLGEVVPNGDLRDRESFRKFRNMNGIAGLEHLQDLLHSLVLRETGDA
jgi:hypothetical protein